MATKFSKKASKKTKSLINRFKTIKAFKVKKAKSTRVTRAFLLNLADDIFNAKTQTFLNLCKGTLQNGPDPLDAKRSMHCGLGELYFAMTGLQPEETHVNESDVIALATKRTTLFDVAQKQIDNARKFVDKMVLAPDIKEQMKRPLSVHPINELSIDYVGYNEHEFNDPKLEQFRMVLDAIPDVNDNDDVTDVVCTPENFKARAKRVADVLRKAAALLPGHVSCLPMKGK